MNAALTAWLMTPEAPDEKLTLEDFLQRPEWHQRVACRGLGTDAFVIEHGAGEYSQRALCADCAVRQECLEVALADPGLQGLWGGTTPRGRMAMPRGAVA